MEKASGGVLEFSQRLLSGYWVPALPRALRAGWRLVNKRAKGDPEVVACACNSSIEEAEAGKS